MSRPASAICADLSKLFAELALVMSGGAPSASAGGAVAPDSDLDGPYGDPEVRKDPPRWTGASMVGKHFGECPSDYLEILASFCDWKAGKDDEKAAKGDEKAAKYAEYARKDAARARGWAKRNHGRPAGDFEKLGGPTNDESDAPDYPF